MKTHLEFCGFFNDRHTLICVHGFMPLKISEENMLLLFWVNTVFQPALGEMQVGYRKCLTWAQTTHFFSPIRQFYLNHHRPANTAWPHVTAIQHYRISRYSRSPASISCLYKPLHHHGTLPTAINKVLCCTRIALIHHYCLASYYSGTHSTELLSHSTVKVLPSPVVRL